MNPIRHLSSSLSTATATARHSGGKTTINRLLAARSTPQRRPYGFSSYGGDDKPEGDRPADPTTRKLEHPGPAPPDTHKQSSSSSSTSGQKSEGDSPSQKSSREPGSSDSENRAPIPSNKARPTLNDGTQSPNVDEHGNPRDDVPQEVKQHNSEMEGRYDRAFNHIAEEGKVEKGFWKGGEGGVQGPGKDGGKR